MKNLKMNGFTLLELLAVIIILAVIALIAVPIILDIINDSKASSEESSVAYYASSVELTYAENMVNDTKVDLRSGADSKTSGVKVVCETVGYLEGRGVVLDKCTVGGTTSYNKLIDTVKAETLYYYLDKHVFVERPNDMDSVIASLDKEPINPPEIPSLTGDKIGDKVLEKFPNLALSNTETKGCAISDNNYTYMGGCYLSGAQDKNYIWFSGFLYRIMGINKDGSIRIISEENITTIPYSASNSKFENSYAEKWLNNHFLVNLKGSNKIVDGVFCQGLDSDQNSIDKDCSEGTKLTRKLGLINLDEYNLSGAYSSYLNTKQYFWTMTTYNHTLPQYVYTINYTINNKGYISLDNPYKIFGIRPVINVDFNTIVTAGDGSVNNNYILNENKDINIAGKLNEKATAGEYVKFADKLYRVVSKNSDNTIKLILDDYYNNSNIPNNIKFGATSNYNEISTILNEDVLNWLVPTADNNNRNKIVSSKWYQNPFNEGNDYEQAIKENDSPINSIVGLINMGEILCGQSATIKNKTSYWTMTTYKLSGDAIFVMHLGGMPLNVATINYYAVRPVINIKLDVNIISGSGTVSNPYQI